MNISLYSRTSRHQQHKTRFIVLSSILVSAILLPLSLLAFPHLVGAQNIDCGNDHSYTIRSGDTLANIAAKYNTTIDAIVSRNGINNPNLINTNQTICIPSSGSSSTQVALSQTTTNVSLPSDSANGYPAGQCTWWANERYHEIHGIYVPWAPYYNAKDWKAAAYSYNWIVSSTPEAGDIIVLQPRVQLADPLYGHVAFVESVSNGVAHTSTLNWGVTLPQKQQVRNIDFYPGPGVTFIHQ